ncbi:MAG: single-stranded DNA exonuclease RecJ, partial [Halomonadaceae bacterium]|nr:single-stranded DNA exonuclease RecJ [Halomonadaceae bacterium]
YGREFESPLFTAAFKVMSASSMGADKTHWRFKLIGAEGGIFEAVWFNAGEECPLDMSDLWRLAFTPELNWWRGNAKLQLMLRAAEQVPFSQGD